MSMNTVSVDRKFLEHCLSVMRGVGELCQPIPRKSEDDPTEYCGGQALAELANCHNKLQETIAYAEQAALTQPEQPEAGRDLAAHIAEAIERDLVAHIAEAIEQERFEIAPADLYRRALEEVIRDALKVFRPQAQEAVAWTFSREDFKELAFDLRRIASSGIMANEKPLTVEFARMVRHVCTTAAHMLNDAHDNYFVVGEGNGRD